MEITLPVHTASLFTQRVRDALHRSMTIGSDIRVIALSDTFKVVDGHRVISRYDPTAYYKSGHRELESRTLFGAQDSIINQTANAYFTAFGCTVLLEQIARNLSEMAKINDASEQYFVFLMPHGVIFSTTGATMHILNHAQENGMSAVTEDFVSRHVRVVLDTGRNAQSKTRSLSPVQSFLNETFHVDVDICGILEGGSSGILKQLEAVSFRLAA